MNEEERHDLIAEAKIIAIANPILFPILAKRKAEAFGRLRQAHKMGRTDTDTIVAELSVLSDIEDELRQKEAIYDTLGEKQNAKRKK